ncbi:MAG: glycosyltransferase [Clostridia bacterium]|nr:glycosyltransferase [Clostridia bacterium]
MRKLNVLLLNDSFPPLIDGVANAVVNYARVIQNGLGKAIVATPKYPKVEDEKYDFEVIRYQSAMLGKRIGYRAGNPFSPRLIKDLEKKKIDIIHTHCPFCSGLLARFVRYYTGAPIIFTYHTKFDVDINKRVRYDAVRKVSTKFLMSNINAADEVWVVSKGAGENLKSLGYKGEYVVMRNGTDFKPGRSSDEEVSALKEQYGVKDDEMVFLFVGRMMWYKGIKLVLDGLKVINATNEHFKMFFVGDGFDKNDIEKYAEDAGLSERCVFVGAIHDREKLRTFYSMANLFLFLSDYDTNGIVVTEAAACSCPSILLRGSCAAEGIENYKNGILVENKQRDVAKELLGVMGRKDKLKEIGVNALNDIYLSWDDAVGTAYDRYEEVLESKKVKNEPMPKGEMFLYRLKGAKTQYHKTKLKLKRKVKKGIAHIFPKM